MNQKRIILSQLLSRKRVDVTSKNYINQIRNVSLLFFALIIVFIGFYLYVNNLTFVTIAVAAATLVFFGGILIFLRNQISGTAIKGDTLILNKDNKRFCVTSLRSIKEIKSFSLLFFQVTRLHYKLDGRTQSTLIFTVKNRCQFTPETLLRHAVILSKKQKANHKPDPVLIQG